MTTDNFLEALYAFNSICTKINDENKIKDSNDNIEYEILQFSQIAKNPNFIYKMVEFYNHNWTGNKDFMHIPDFITCMKNCLKYPIIIAHEKDCDELLGIATIKYFENDNQLVDPYFPEKNAKYFSITGILTKKDSFHKGVGKKIYEASIRSTYEYSKLYKDTRLMLVIDCRNYHSVNGLKAALKNIKKNGNVGLNHELIASIIGYYELRNKDNQELIEAPTIVIEINLNEETISHHHNEQIVMKFKKDKDKNLFLTVLKELKEWLGNINLQSVIEDSECGIVSFYSVKDTSKTRIDRISIMPDGTIVGNSRKMDDLSFMYKYNAILPLVYVEEKKLVLNRGK
ncbi:MAG: hypothetical protein RSB71_04235 [Bacilli bacterium]